MKKKPSVKSSFSEIRIRNVNAAAIARIDQLAKAKGMSRNVFLKKQIETFAILAELKEQENKYDNLLVAVTTVLEKQGKEISEIKRMLESWDNDV